MGQVAETPENLLQGVPIGGAGLRLQMLERLLDLGERLWVDQLPQLLLAKQLAQELAIQCERSRPPLGVGRVALVHVRRDVVEEQRGGERGGRWRLDLDQRDVARMQVAQERLERGDVEHVAEALAVGLQDHREAREVLRHLEQALGAQALLPERRPLAGIGAGDQQRARRVLAEPGAKERRARQLGDDHVLKLVGLDQDQVSRRRLVRIRQVDHDAVVRPDRVGLEVALFADAPRERQPPGRVDTAAERREDAQPPVADLVAEALDDDRLVGGDNPGRRLLLAQVGDEVLRGAPVEVVVPREALGLHRYRLAGERADRPAEFGRTPDAVAFPERHRSGNAGRRRDDHAVARDVLDSPGGRAEQESLPRARLVDHLLVELADPAAVGEVDAVEAAVRNRPGVRDRELPRALAAPDRAGGPIPDEPRAQLGKALRRIAPIEHVEHVLELLAAELRERLGGVDDALDLVDLPFRLRAHRDQVLGQDVERVARDDRLLDRALPHALGDHGALDQVAAELREDAAPRDRVERVAGASDALQPSASPTSATRSG